MGVLESNENVCNCLQLSNMVNNCLKLLEIAKIATGIAYSCLGIAGKGTTNLH